MASRAAAADAVGDEVVVVLAAMGQEDSKEALLSASRRSEIP